MIYAVKTGRNPGLYDTWEECSNQVLGYSGAEYKKFKTVKEAVAFIEGLEEKVLEGCYIDGSFCKGNGYGYSVVVIGSNNRYVEYGTVPEKFRGQRNVGCELYAALRAIEIISKVKDKVAPKIYYDYEGVYKFINNWNTNTPLTRFYKEEVNRLLNKIDLDIEWVKVKSHSNVVFNDLADDYAKMGTLCNSKNTIKPFGELSMALGLE